MISERHLARSFSGFWEELLPLLTPKFVHLFNEIFRQRLRDDRGFDVQEVQRSEDGDNDPAMIAEVAFFVAQRAVESGVGIDGAFEDEEMRRSAELDAIESIKGHLGVRDGTWVLTFTKTEELEAKALALNYEYFFRLQPPSTKIVFHALIPGAGFIASCRADIVLDQSVFEVKTVARNLGSKDIRQLLVYLALQSQAGEQRWKRAGFLNPRRALFFEFDVDEFIASISGGRSSAEVFRELLDFASARDVQIDDGTF